MPPPDRLVGQPPLFNIPAHVAFVDALAAGLLARLGDDPLALARTQILLPNRRAARALTDAFVRLSANKGLLLPRLVPVGDMGDDSFDRFAAGDTALPPAVPPLQRRLQLARLVRQLPAGDGGRSAVEALRLGDELGTTLDTLLAEEVPASALKTVIDDADLAQHWQETLAFLDIVITHWPPARDALGGSDGGTRLAAQIDALVARWQVAPPTAPIVVAGVAGSSPPITRLLAAVLRLPHGMVVLPGLDDDMSDAGCERWDAIHCAGHDAEGGPRDSEEHPHYALKALLVRLGLDRSDVRDWGATSPHDGPAARSALVAAAMAPADAADGWHSLLPGAAATGFAGVTAIEAATPSEEAQIIALALRRALETPGRTAALVTRDRSLARRVAAHCRRWGIAVDDSAGTPLQRTPPGALALALVEALAQGFAPVALLAVLKHPLVSGGGERLPWLAMARRLDLALRGIRPPAGLEAIGEQVESVVREAAVRARRRQTEAERAATTARDTEFTRWWDGVAALLDPLARLADRREITLPALAAALREVATALASDRAWAGADGRALAQLVEAIEAEGSIFGPLAVADAPALLAALLADVAVRPAYGGHPRLAILGPVEAQLQRADLMVLGGLNEVSWPGRPAPDPWLAPAIRARLGLPGLARATGLAAHDFVRGLGAPQVLLTRARRDASAPLVPSRFWLRLQAFAGGLPDDKALLAIAQRLDGTGPPAVVAPPSPHPPAARRPQRLNVTDIDTLVADPFAFYAKRLLGLRPLDPLDQDPTAATRGTRIHGVLEEWIKSGGGSLDRLAQLTEAMLLAEGRQFPLLRALWAPRARRALAWAGEQIHAREADGWIAIAAEASGELRLANGIILDGRADRIDRDDDSGIAIIDYKTGSAPTPAQVKAGLANQLGLLAAMATAGLMRSNGRPVPPGPARQIAYWELKGGKIAGKIVDPLKGKDAPTAADHADEVVALVTALTSRLLQTDAPFLPKIHPGLAWGDYDHLARVNEWQDRPAARR